MGPIEYIGQVDVNVYLNLLLQLFGPLHRSSEPQSQRAQSSIFVPENFRGMSGSPGSVEYSKSSILGPITSLPILYMLQMRILEIVG